MKDFELLIDYSLELQYKSIVRGGLPLKKDGEKLSGEAGKKIWEVFFTNFNQVKMTNINQLP